MFRLRLPQLLLGLAAVAIIATAIVYIAQQLGEQSALTNTNTTANVSDVVCTADVRSCQDGTYVNRVPPTCEFAECPDGVTPGFVVQDGTTIYTNEEHGFRLSISGTYECNAVNCPATGDTMGLGRENINVSVAKTGTAATPRDWLKAAAGEDYANLVISDTTLGGIPAASVYSVKVIVALNWDGATDGTGNARIADNGSKLTVALKNGKAYIVEFRVGLHMSPDSSRYDAVLRAFSFTDQTAATKDWKTFTNTRYGWRIQYPAAWKIANDADDDPQVELHFDEGQQGLQEFFTDTRQDTLEEWRDKQKTQLPNAKLIISEMTIGGVRAIRIDTNVYDNATYIGFRKGDVFVNVITSNAEMITNGVLDTFQFTD